VVHISLDTLPATLARELGGSVDSIMAVTGHKKQRQAANTESLKLRVKQKTLRAL
jgi:hypothetical protein